MQVLPWTQHNKLTPSDILQANEEKLRLEEKQRQERNAVEAAGEPWQPRWFVQVRAVPFTSPLQRASHIPLLPTGFQGRALRRTHARPLQRRQSCANPSAMLASALSIHSTTALARVHLSAAFSEQHLFCAGTLPWFARTHLSAACPSVLIECPAWKTFEDCSALALWLLQESHALL